MVSLSPELPSPRRQRVRFMAGCALLPGEVVNTHGPVEPDKDNIRKEPYSLPQGFTWDALDLGDRGVVSRPSRPLSGRGRRRCSPAIVGRQLLLKPSRTHES